MSRAKEVSLATFENEVLSSPVPTLTFVIHGEVVGQIEGVPSESDLNGVVQQMLDLN
jgi:hypothetical protein